MTTISAPARYLLDCIGGIEAPMGYGTVYGNKQSRLPKPLVSWTVNEIIGASPSFTARFGSSACGRYQFMRDTLIGLRKQVPGLGDMRFTPELQDMLGVMLLRRRGFDRFMAGQITLKAFGKALAQEWASFPVLTTTTGAHRTVARGQSYYAGDGMNKALVSADQIEAWLTAALRMKGGAPVRKPVPVAALVPDEPEDEPEPVEAPEEPEAAFIAPAGASGSAKGTLSSLWALVQGKPPVPQADRKAVVQEAKAELPHIASSLGGLRLAGLGGLFASLAGGAQDTGVLGSVQASADQATSTFQSVQTLVNIVLSAVRWGVTHWWVFGLVISLYVLAKVGMAVYGVWMQVQQWRIQNATLDALKSKTGG